MPLVVRRRLSATRTRSSNLLVARLLPTLTSAAVAGVDLLLTGVLLGADTDDVMVALYREADGVTVRMFDTVTTAADQQTLTVSERLANRACGRLLRHPVRQQPAGALEPARGGAMSASHIVGEPAAFTPGVRTDDPLAYYWLSQVTLRLRREVCWLWRERRLQGAAPRTHTRRRCPRSPTAPWPRSICGATPRQARLLSRRRHRRAI